MASDILPHPAFSPNDPEIPRAVARKSQDPFEALLLSPASLRWTVLLFALSIFLIFAGTLAQTRMDVWDVVRQYFRTWVAWMDVQIFFPPAIFPTCPVASHFFPFPGGWMIGAGLGINLLAAHSLRFKVQARGARLWAGLAVIARRRGNHLAGGDGGLGQGRGRWRRSGFLANPVDRFEARAYGSVLRWPATD